VLDVMVSLNQLDSIKTETAKTTIINSALITIIIAFACGVFVLLLVNIPIRKLTKGIDEVGKGNLNYKISIASRNELGLMAVRFNEMAEKLNAAYNEIKDWSENLNKKVNEKSEELKNIYKQIIQMEKLASLGKLSATVAHELNNPLEGILTYSKLIAKKLKETPENGSNVKLINYLELISDESSRCGKIVKDLLLFSSKADNEFIKVNIIEVVDKSISLIKHHLEINKINLIKEYNCGSVNIFCNPQKIQQALMSLLINAIEAMPLPGKIIVRIDQENDNIVIRIIDEGIGISSKDLPLIFEPFYTTKEAAKGTGLGLAVVYGIINQIKGSVEVEKTSPTGTTFKVKLPLNFKKGGNHE
jgi:two-component system NtrC family sensor kinase